MTQGLLGAFGANHHLRQSVVFLYTPAMPAPDAHIGSAAALLNGHGSHTNPATREFLTKFMQAFAVWVERQLAD